MVENVKYYRYQENEEAEKLVRMFFMREYMTGPNGSRNFCKKTKVRG